MIRESDKHHGAALGAIVDAWGSTITLKRLSALGGAAYELDEKAVVYLKYSTARLSPWSFTFHPEHWIALTQLDKKYSICVVGLVCNQDGVVGVTFRELGAICPMITDRVRSLIVRRAPRHHYSVSCSGNDLPGKVSKEALIEKLKGAIPPVRLNPNLPWPVPVKIRA